MTPGTPPDSDEGANDSAEQDVEPPFSPPDDPYISCVWYFEGLCMEGEIDFSTPDEAIQFELLLDEIISSLVRQYGWRILVVGGILTVSGFGLGVIGPELIAAATMADAVVLVGTDAFVAGVGMYNNYKLSQLELFRDQLDVVSEYRDYPNSLHLSWVSDADSQTVTYTMEVPGVTNPVQVTMDWDIPGYHLIDGMQSTYQTLPSGAYETYPAQP